MVSTMNREFFQVKANREVDRLIERGVFSAEHEAEIRNFVRRSYAADCSVLLVASSGGMLGLGIASFAGAYCVRLSGKLSSLQGKLKGDHASETIV